MPIIKTYICGRCKKESNSALGFGTIIVFMHTDPEMKVQNGYTYIGNDQRRDIWCDDCSKAAGLSYLKPEPQAVTTLEDIVREVCKEEIENQ